MSKKKSYKKDLLEVMTKDDIPYGGCIIKKIKGGYQWLSFSSTSLDEVKKYIDSALESLNKSIVK